MTKAGQPIELYSLSGAAVPEEIASDAAALRRLPEGARRRFWEALGPSLREPLPPGVESMLDAFCEATGAGGSGLARALKACRFLVREAGRRNVAADLFARDLTALLPGDAEMAALLSGGYEGPRRRSAGSSSSARSSITARCSSASSGVSTPSRRRSMPEGSGNRSRS